MSDLCKSQRATPLSQHLDRAVQVIVLVVCAQTHGNEAHFVDGHLRRKLSRPQDAQQLGCHGTSRPGTDLRYQDRAWGLAQVSPVRTRE